MKKRTLMSSCFILTMLIAPAASAAPQTTVFDAAQALSPGGNTIGGPGVFSFQPNQRVNVMDLSSSPASLCASILVIEGHVDILVKDPADVVIEGSIADVTSGLGGLTAGATACGDNVGLVEVLCSATAPDVCKGAWRVDKK